MLRDTPSNWGRALKVDGTWVGFSLASEGTKVSMHALHALLLLIAQQLGDYGYLTDSGQFCSRGNLFSDFGSLISEADFTPRRKTMTGYGTVDGTGLSLPNNPVFNSFLASLAPRLMKVYLVTRVVQRHRKSYA